MKILFTGGGGAGCESLWSLLEGKYEVHFADAEVDRVDPGISSTRAHEIPKAADPEFARTLFELCGHLNISLLIPTVDEELLPVLSVPEEARFGTDVMLNSSSFVSLMLDKLACMQSLASTNVNVPESAELITGAEWKRFPAIIKPRAGRGSQGISIVTSEWELKHVSALAAKAGQPMIIQEFVDGEEFTVQLVATRNSELISVVPVLVQEKRGITLRAKVQMHPEVRRACIAFHEHFRPAGTYNIQGMLTADGGFMVFEVNPRVSTTLCLAIASGIDPIKAFYGMGLQAGLLTPEPLELSRHWTNHFARATQSADQHE